MSDKYDKDNEKDVNTNDKDGVSRRRFIKNTGLVAGGVVGGSLLGGVVTNQWNTTPDKDTQTKGNKTTAELQDARMFFSRKEDFEVLKAATERIFPEDDNGPGAVELGAPYFIDKQLAGQWGSNAKAYMRDPFKQGKQVQDYEHQDRDQDKQGPHSDTQNPTPTPRYQTRLNRGEMFIQGLRKLDKERQDRFKKKFIDAEGDQQDEILEAFEKGEVQMKGVEATTFFNLLLQTTLEGVYADPVYGGNKNMQGWVMKEYPGPRAAYINDIESDDFIKMEPKSLRDYQG